MLTLVEPCVMSSLLAQPHLGCAMLIAACQEKGIKTTLVKGQTRYIKDMFINDNEELWGLIQDLKEDDLKKIGITEYKKSIQEKGIRQFQDELKSLYQYVIVDKDPRHYLNAHMVERFRNLHNIFTVIYFYYLRNLNHTRLKIIDRYVSEIVKSNPRYIGFSLQGSFGQADFGLLSRIIIKRIKELTGVPIITGGSLTPFIDLKQLDKIFEEEYFDYLVIGAGERALPSLIEALDNKKEPRGIANVFYKKDGRIKGNDLEVIDDLDNLPMPDYSQFDLDLYLTPKRILPLQTARGCNWRRCTFCSHHSIYFGKHKTFGIKKVIETIKHLQDAYECSHFFISDEELPPNRAKIISKALLDNKLNICIETPARLVDEYNNLLSLMRKAGFTSINWGMESGCQRILDLMNKGTRVSTMGRILRKSSKNKIANHCFVFFGFPGETEKEAQQTVEFLKKHADYIENIMPGVFVLESHSPVGRNPENWGIEIKEDGTFSNRSGMSREEVTAFFSNLDKGLKIKSINLTSDKMKYLSSGHIRRTSHFLISSHVPLSNTTLPGYIGRRKKLNNIFPVILGEIKKKGSRIRFYPVNIKEPLFVNQYHPEKEKVFDRLKEKMFILSDGTLSIEDISVILYNDFKARYGKEYTHKRCIDFFREIFSKNWGLAFAKSWDSSYNKILR